MDLNIIWFILIVVLFIGYAVLDGFDLGIGTLYLSFKQENERQLLLKAIGPFWNGNEVWLVAGGGALFAAFPNAYASIFSGLYLPLMLLLSGIIFRAIAIEFRNKEESVKWRRNWDVAFSVASIIVLFVLGVAVANFITGLPIDEYGDMSVPFFSLFTPFSIILGVQSVFFFAMHGAIYGAMKTENELYANLVKKGRTLSMISFGMFILSFIVLQFVSNPQQAMISNIGMIVSISLLLLVYLLLLRNKIGIAFFVSSLVTLVYIASIAVHVFPNFVVSTINYNYNLTIYNAASSPKTLEVMLIIALIGVPIVIAYTIFVYRIFRGKVKIETEHDTY